MTQDELAALVEGIAPVVRDFVKAALTDVAARVQVLDTQLAGLVTVSTEIGTMRERLAVLETRAPVPGPPGPAGTNGVDGLGFDDLGVTQADDRSVTITATRGDLVKEIGTARFPLDIYRGVWLEGKAYEPGDGVTWAGSEWHCSAATTTKPGDGSKAWTLKVKRGRDGKDGKDGGPGPAGPQGRDWQQVYDDTRRR
jgi:integrin beta 3